MDPAVAAGIRRTASGEEYMDMSKIAQDLASTMSPESASYEIGPDGKELVLEFSEADKSRIRNVCKQVDELQAKAGNSPVQNPSGPSPQPYMMGMGMMHSAYSSPESMEYASMLEEDLGFEVSVEQNVPVEEEDFTTRPPRRESREKFYVCVEKLMPDGTRKLFGEEEAVKAVEEYEAKTAAANADFKDEATSKWVTESMSEVYNLATELRRYNSVLAEQLLWFQHESEPADFDRFKAKCLKKLIEYRSRDPLAEVKSNPLITRNGKVFIAEGKEIDEKEFNEYRKMISDALEEETQKEKEQHAIDKYVEESDRRLSGLRQELSALTKHDNPKAAIHELQMMTNICICTTQDEYERECKWRDRLNRQWNPAQIDSQNKYLVYKKLMRCCADEVPEGMTYDQWFDDWWNKPVQAAESTYRPSYIAAMKMQMRFTNIVNSQPTPEQIKASYDAETARRQRAFDLGMVDPNMDLNQFLNGPYGASFLMHRTMECIRKRQQQSLLNKYDPNRLHDIFRQKDPEKEALFGPRPDYDTLVNSEEYQKRRKLFVESIYQKNSLGTLHGGGSHG
jgi:hypothetical protein